MENKNEIKKTNTKKDADAGMLILAILNAMSICTILVIVIFSPTSTDTWINIWMTIFVLAVPIFDIIIASLWAINNKKPAWIMSVGWNFASGAGLLVGLFGDSNNNLGAWIMIIAMALNVILMGYEVLNPSDTPGNKPAEEPKQVESPK